VRVLKLVLISMLATMLLVAGCGSPAADNDGGDEVQPEQILRVGMTYDWDNLDPAQAGNRTSHQIANSIFNGLVRFELGGTKLEGDLAKEWSVSDDGLTYTFILHEGVQFHHGYGEMTAEDVKFSLERVMDPDVSRYAGDVEAIESVEVTGQYEVKVHLKRVDAALLYKLSEGIGYIVSKAAVEERGEDFAHNPVGTGPFAFESWSPDEKTVLVKNEDYFGGDVELDEVLFIPITEASTLYKAFESKEVDLIMVTDPDRYEKYKADSSVNLFESPGLITRFIAMNSSIPPFDDLNVRLAMQYAINRDEIIDYALKGMSVKADSPLAPGTLGHKAVFDYPYDPEKAKQLLAEAGYPDGFETTLYLPAIDRFTVPGNIFAENLRDIGVTCKIETMEVATYLAKVRAGEAAMYSHSQNPMVMPNQFFFQRYHPGNFPPGDNDTFYDNAEVTQWIEELDETNDEARQLALIEMIQQQVAADSHYINLDHEKFIWAAHDYVKGFLSDPWRSYRVETVSITSR